MKAIVVTDKAAGTPGMKLVERPEPQETSLASLSGAKNGSSHKDSILNLGMADNVGHWRGGALRLEELIPPARRRSLTLHKPCWWPGSAARGAAPSVPQSARESTQAGGAFRARDEDLELFRAIASSKVFTEFERAFTEATGLPVSLEPVESFQLSFHDRAAIENSHTTVCYGGLCETIVPLRLGNRLIGLLRTWPVFRRKRSERRWHRTRKLLTSRGTKLDQNVSRGAYFETRVASCELHAAAVKLLTIFAEHLMILSNEILIQRNNAEPPMITKAKGFIREHYAEDLSLPQVAQFANSSPFHFCKLFKRATGLSFAKFVARVRIESARNLLINPQRRVTEVAYEVGFQSLTHFNRVFRKILGQSPTEYRLKVQNRGRAVAS
jgi:AraC-like DNA-binding protein